MQCAKCQELYDDAVRGELSEAAAGRVRAHVSSCPVCSVYWQENDTLSQVLLETAEQIPIPDAGYFSQRARNSMLLANAIDDIPLAPAPDRGRLRARVIDLIQPARLMRAAAVLALGAVLGFVASRPWLWNATDTARPTVARQPSSAAFEPNRRLTASQVQPVSNVRAALDVESQANHDRFLQELLALQQYEQYGETARSQLSKLTDYDQDRAAMDPAMVKVWGDTVKLFDKLQTTDELDRLRRIETLSRRVQPAAVLASLQDLKILLVRNGQTDYIPVIHQMEAVLGELAAASPQPNSVNTAYQETYQEAERALIARDYEKAMVLFRKVVVQAPTSYLGALAKFQMGDLNYEQFRDYEKALADYSKCLEESKPQYLSQAILNQIHERVERITQNQMDHYAPLALFHGAESANSPVAAVAQYAGLLDRYPRSTLVGPTIENMTQLARQSVSDDSVVNPIIEALDTFQQQNPNHPFELHAQLGITDINLDRYRNQAQAKLDYTKILHDAKDPKLVSAIQQRLRRLPR
jgi:TolA-binding protein